MCETFKICRRTRSVQFPHGKFEKKNIDDALFSKWKTNILRAGIIFQTNRMEIWVRNSTGRWLNAILFERSIETTGAETFEFFKMNFSNNISEWKKVCVYPFLNGGKLTWDRYAYLIFQNPNKEKL